MEFLKNNTNITALPKKKLISKNQAKFIRNNSSLLTQLNLIKNEGVTFKFLPRITTFNVEKVGDVNKINLDNKASYNEKQAFHLIPGIYTILDVPELNAIRLNKDDNNITMHSKKSKSNEDGKNCYWGNVTLIVKGNFDKNGLYCCMHGAMGREDLFHHRFSNRYNNS